jgi:hypothetical protein
MSEVPMYLAKGLERAFLLEEVAIGLSLFSGAAVCHLVSEKVT